MASIVDQGSMLEVTLESGSFTVPAPRGDLTADAPLAKLIWFKTGGPAELLFEPEDADDLAAFLAALPADVPVMGLGLGSNMIVRDGGVLGVVVRLGKPFFDTEVLDETTVRFGGGTPGVLASSTARDAGIAGMEFLKSIPGTVGGFVRMNGGAYGREVKDILTECDVILRDGTRKTFALSDMGYTYRHSDLPDGAIVVSATMKGEPGDPDAIQAEMDRISEAREASQPLRTKTGGSTFKNPDGTSAWKLVDEAGCRGLIVGDAQVSEKHTNFLINRGEASAADIEMLGEEVRRRVKDKSGVTLEWEIRRVGKFGATKVEPGA